MYDFENGIAVVVKESESIGLYEVVVILLDDVYIFEFNTLEGANIHAKWLEHILKDLTNGKENLTEMELMMVKDVFEDLIEDSKGE